jgi:hypothetical protein
MAAIDELVNDRGIIAVQAVLQESVKNRGRQGSRSVSSSRPSVRVGVFVPGPDRLEAGSGVVLGQGAQ